VGVSPYGLRQSRSGFSWRAAADALAVAITRTGGIRTCPSRPISTARPAARRPAGTTTTIFDISAPRP
jgi:hypothetical protein